MEDQLVEFKTAELAFAKGFDEQCDRVFYKGKLIPSVESNCNSLNEANEVSAPTQTALQKWLREDRGIHIIFLTTTKNEYVFHVVKLEIGIGHCGGWVDEKNGAHIVYEKALEKSFRRAFKLIK